MRLLEEHIQAIRRIVSENAGESARVWLFGSRLWDDAKGGDVDLLVELPEPVEHPAGLSARLAARISRSLEGRQVDVVVLAPNLRRLPIHDIALNEGRLL